MIDMSKMDLDDPEMNEILDRGDPWEFLDWLKEKASDGNTHDSH